MNKTTRALLVLLVVGWIDLIPLVRRTLYRGLYLLATGHLSQFRDLLLSLGPWAAAVSTLLMISQSVAIPVPVTLLMVANGLVSASGTGCSSRLLEGLSGRLSPFTSAEGWAGK